MCGPQCDAVLDRADPHPGPRGRGRPPTPVRHLQPFSPWPQRSVIVIEPTTRARPRFSRIAPLGSCGPVSGRLHQRRPGLCDGSPDGPAPGRRIRTPENTSRGPLACGLCSLRHSLAPRPDAAGKLARAYLSLDAAGATTVLQQARDILRLQPELGILPKRPRSSKEARHDPAAGPQGVVAHHQRQSRTARTVRSTVGTSDALTADPLLAAGLGTAARSLVACGAW